jgi:hypothetical protein
MAAVLRITTISSGISSATAATNFRFSPACHYRQAGFLPIIRILLRIMASIFLKRVYNI